MKKKNYNKPSTSTAEQRRNKIYAIILACAMVFWTIASLLGTFAFARTLTGSAETATVREVERKSVRQGKRFQEVDLHTSGITWAYDDVYVNNPCSTLFDTSIRFYEDGFEVVLGGSEVFQTYDTQPPYSMSVSGNFLRYDIDQDTISISNELEGVDISYESAYRFEQPFGGDFRGSYVRTVNCVADVFKRADNSFSLSYQYEFLWYSLDDVFLGSDTLTISPSGFFLYGTYFDVVYPFLSFIRPVSDTSSISCGSWSTHYEVYFDNGYDVGLPEGYNDGYYTGNREGYAEGFQQGVEDAGEYTFFTLISAVIDAPIQAFTGLFNFDLLGINLADFFFSLLTVAAIIAVIRLFL